MFMPGRVRVNETIDTLWMVKASHFQHAGASFARDDLDGTPARSAVGAFEIGVCNTA